MKYLFIVLAMLTIVSCDSRDKTYKVQSASLLYPSSTKQIVALDSMYKVGDTVLISIGGEPFHYYVILEKEGK